MNDDEHVGLSLWEQRCMLRLAILLDGLNAEFIVRGGQSEETVEEWRKHAGGILLLLASVLRDGDLHSLYALASQAGQIGFRRIREAGLDPLDPNAVKLYLEREGELLKSREIQLEMDKVWRSYKTSNKDKNYRDKKKKR